MIDATPVWQAWNDTALHHAGTAGHRGRTRPGDEVHRGMERGQPVPPARVQGRPRSCCCRCCCWLSFRSRKIVATEPGHAGRGTRAAPAAVGVAAAGAGGRAVRVPRRAAGAAPGGPVAGADSGAAPAAAEGVRRAGRVALRRHGAVPALPRRASCCSASRRCTGSTCSPSRSSPPACWRGCCTAARRRRAGGDARRRRPRWLPRIFGWIGVLALVVSAVANVVGNVSLAEMLSGAVLDSAYVGLALYAGASVLSVDHEAAAGAARDDALQRDHPARRPAAGEPRPPDRAGRGRHLDRRDDEPVPHRAAGVRLGEGGADASARGRADLGHARQHPAVRVRGLRGVLGRQHGAPGAARRGAAEDGPAARRRQQRLLAQLLRTGARSA